MRANRLSLALVVIAALASVSGCLQPDPDDVSEAEARHIAVNGMRDLAHVLAGAETGTLRSFHMRVVAPITNASDNGTTMATLDVRMEYGQNDVSVRHVALVDDRQRHAMSVWCSPHDVRYQWDGDVYQERHVTDPARRDPCSFDRVPEAADLLAPFTPAGADALPVPEVFVENGAVTAVFHLGSGETLTVQHDPGGLVRSVNGQGTQGHYEAAADYGLRPTLQPPAGTERIPAHIETSIHHDDQTSLDVYEVVASWHSPPIEDIEARWVARNTVDTEPAVLLTYPLHAPDDTPDGERFRFHDNDGDGRVTVGDHYTFDAPAALPEPGDLVMHELVLYDLWADEEVNAPVPGIALPMVALATIGLVAVLRRFEA